MVVRALLLILTLLVAAPAFADERNPLERYVAESDPATAWKVDSVRREGGLKLVSATLTSQRWRDIVWQHRLLVVIPDEPRNSREAFLFVTGSGDTADEEKILRKVASTAGIVAATVTDVPNQPLFGNLKEDALLAHTFEQYVKTGDAEWPIILPMVKSARAAMDAVTAIAHDKGGVLPAGFYVSGSSKRGWTTWLIGAFDSRIRGIAPRVFEMVNIPKQVDLAQRSYGRQSEKIHDYTDRDLVAQLTKEPRLKELSRWIDPWEYRARYTMPKLILLGTNDRYWVVDSLREYWGGLPQPKLAYQSPNEGHHLGEGSWEQLLSWLTWQAAGETPPGMTWKFESGESPAIVLSGFTRKPKKLTLWHACAKTRDLRDAEWKSREVEAGSTGETRLAVDRPGSGYCAWMGEARFPAHKGLPAYAASTEAFVLPN